MNWEIYKPWRCASVHKELRLRKRIDKSESFNTGDVYCLFLAELTEYLVTLSETPHQSWSDISYLKNVKPCYLAKPSIEFAMNDPKDEEILTWEKSI